MGLVSPCRRQLVDGEGFFGARGFVFADDLEAFAGFFQHALRLLGLLENVVDLLQGRDFGEDALLQQQADLVDHHQLAGIGDGDGQLAVLGFLQRNEVVAEHQFRRELLEQLVVKLEVGEVDELAAITPRDVLGAFQIGERDCPSRPSGWPFSPLTKSDFLSAVAIARFISGLSVSGRPRLTLVDSQSEDRQIQRDQHSAHKNCHHDQNQRLNQRHGRAQRRLHIFFIELRH